MFTLGSPWGIRVLQRVDSRVDVGVCVTNAATCIAVALHGVVGEMFSAVSNLGNAVPRPLDRIFRQ